MKPTSCSNPPAAGRNNAVWRVMAGALVGLALLAGVGCGGPRMQLLSEKPLKPLDRTSPVEVYIGMVQPPYKDVAVVESTAYAFVDNPVKLKQLEQLRKKARHLGANAVQNIRMLPKHVKGYTIDERVPFAAWKQGDYSMYFMRGEAILLPASRTASAGSVSPGSDNPGPDTAAAAPKEGWVIDRFAPPERLKVTLDKIALPASGAAAVPEKKK